MKIKNENNRARLILETTGRDFKTNWVCRISGKEEREERLQLTRKFLDKHVHGNDFIYLVDDGLYQTSENGSKAFIKVSGSSFNEISFVEVLREIDGGQA